jgi:AcrR family transcriptional regulator
VVTTRAEQRRNTQERIVAAARKLFAERGYERTTIRAIAAEAGTDAGLLMRYYGSKADLFAVAVGNELADDETLSGDRAQIAAALVESLAAKLSDEPVGLLAMLQTLQSGPGASGEIRAMMADQHRQIAAALPHPDADLRAGLVAAITIGTVLGRYVLRLDGLTDASADQITALVAPYLHSLLDT